MFSNSIFKGLVAVSAFATTVLAAPHAVARQESSELSLTAKLLLADTAADRYALLPNDEDYIYDFNTEPIPLTNRKTFPALTGTGVSLAYAVLPPCSLGPLHIHPRTAELFLVTNGRANIVHIPELFAGPISEGANARVLRANLSSGMMTVIPQGAVHTSYNPTCENATAAASFGTDDSGLVPIVTNLLAVPDDVLGDVLGGSLDEGAISAVKNAVAESGMAIAECKKTCGL